jgi:hypothetical protein
MVGSFPLAARGDQVYGHAGPARGVVEEGENEVKADSLAPDRFGRPFVLPWARPGLAGKPMSTDRTNAGGRVR